MPLLSDPKHEAFAQGLAKGMSQTDAYANAGYKPHRQNAARLMTNDAIQARVRELQEKAALKVVETSAFEARAMFEALMQDITDAKAAGDHKAAADLRKFMIRCFGYEDSPTLTHEHVNGKPIPQTKAREEDDEPKPESREASNIASFASALKKFQRRVG